MSNKIIYEIVKHLWAVFMVLLVTWMSDIDPFGEWPDMPPQDKFLCISMIIVLLYTILQSWGKYDE